ncbi:protoheme IX farnesyltransferase 2 [Marinithermofilum abyssi]|uniref:Protoheme IX farnesyltransferase n=1 Tax=Marinithermofilum abyssi TaxID=1571185 RepID=A0A8J2VJ93_9BACL|nr:heme o synthase [Marinithermofilum abyssi]GGE26819.1 protoheme IX farnesyltransferase 2 [Marinithermofilum abyssi]
MERPMTQQSTTRILGEESQQDETQKATWRDYWEITKPGINASNLMAAFTGFWLAGHNQFNFSLLLAMLLGTALVIAGGCTVNNFIDRDIDPHMARTRNRPVAAGRIHPQTALWMGIGLFLAGTAVLVALVNPLSALLAAVGFFIYVFIYTAWTKRTTYWNTVVGSISGAVPPMIGWVAVTGSVDAPAWVLFLFMFVWQPPHFFALAMLKAEDYRAAGIPMLPVVKGHGETKRQILWFVIAILPASLLLYATHVVGWIYLAFALIMGAVYLVLALNGWKTQDHESWARKMFIYSLIYLTSMQLIMLLDPALLG